ncbi:MAG: aspartate aminotransferase family protein [Clostridia bacterium]|nr:aspartate aminotransferase family protein [Clostridia bacterium]
MSAQSKKNKDKKYIANTYARYDLMLQKGKGSALTGEGREFIDFGGGIAVNIFGAADNEWIKAVCKQTKKLAHTSNLYYTEPCIELAELLCKKTGLKKVFFSNSGAEANECAIKCARKYSFDKYGDGRYEIITLNNSFHGRTMATLSATGQQHFHNYFFPFLEGFAYAEPEIEDIVNKLSGKTCAIMLELVQGEGGVKVLTKDFVQAVDKLCKDKDILLIIDEVQTGNGRTGAMYAYMQYAIMPDIMTTAKGLGGGLPIGATLFAKKTENVLTSGSHGSTFGANPICAAGALSVMRRIDEKLLDEVCKKGEYIKTALLQLKKVKEITGLGLMLGVSIETDAKEAVRQCMEKGLLLLTAKDKLRLLPALNISYGEIDKGLEILKEVLE